MPADGSGGSFGRLRSGPDPVLWETLYAPSFESDRRTTLPWLLEVDAAHVTMLAETGILPRPQAAELLQLNRDLKDRCRRGEIVLDPPPGHRGLFLAYEQLYIARLGREVGGAAHVARSRNDINATIARLRLRTGLLTLLDELAGLLAAAADLAAEHADTAMSGFTHLQPAQPTTFGHYVTAVLAELERGAGRVLAGYDETNRSPLGAGAGLGTSFPIDRERTAACLGFDGVVDNSLDAVASRDYAASVLSSLAILGVTLTRVALDLQLWSGEPFGFLGWPDELVSTSSMMPQKRNAFVLENVRGRAVAPASALVGVLLGLKNTPFTNSVEISSEATSHLWPALSAMADAVRLLALLLRNTIVHGDRMREFLARSETAMTALADYLVREHGLSFRAAHETVGHMLSERSATTPWTPAEVRAGLREASRATLDRELDVEEPALAAVLDPEACVRRAAGGGGPAPEIVRDQLRRLREKAARWEDEVAARRRRLASASELLQAGIDRILGFEGGPR